MAQTNNGSGDDDRAKLRSPIPAPVDEQQIIDAQNKVDRLMTMIAETYETSLVRNVRLEDLDMRSTDLFRDAEKMKNMAHKMHDKFFWQESKSNARYAIRPFVVSNDNRPFIVSLHNKIYSQQNKAAGTRSRLC